MVIPADDVRIYGQSRRRVRVVGVSVVNVVVVTAVVNWRRRGCTTSDYKLLDHKVRCQTIIPYTSQACIRVAGRDRSKAKG